MFFSGGAREVLLGGNSGRRVLEEEIFSERDFRFFWLREQEGEEDLVADFSEERSG